MHCLLCPACVGVGGGWVGCVHIRFCRLSLKYLLIVVGDDSLEIVSAAEALEDNCSKGLESTFHAER